MLELFWALVGSKWVRRLGLCVAVVAGYAWWEGRTENKGAARVVTEINTQAGKLSAKATQERERADVSDAAERLRKRSCRDC